MTVFFWTRYSNYLAQDKNLLGNPHSEKIFARRGPVIGDVQSCKTLNYTAICNKAADAGYNVIIVLTGMLEDLRNQTQEGSTRNLPAEKANCSCTIQTKKFRDLDGTILFVIKKNQSIFENLLTG